MTTQKKTAVTDEELQSRRVYHCKRVLALFEDPSSVASQSVAAYSYLLDECLADIAIEVLRETLFTPDRHLDDNPLVEPATTATAEHHNSGVSTTGVDIFGQVHNAIALEVVECLNCGRKLAAGRYAPHLEKCLGRGRSSARATSRRHVQNS